MTTFENLGKFSFPQKGNEIEKNKIYCLLIIVIAT